MMRTRFSFLAVGLAVMLALSGCSGNRRASVTGKVTIAGKPLPGGTIRFVSVADAGKIGGGQIKADGTYEVPDAPVGECKVVIDNTHLDPNAKKESTLPGAPGTGGGMPGMKGAPGTGAAPGASGPKASDKAKMGSAPKGADVPGEMSAGKADTAGQKYVKIDVGYTKPDTTNLKADVKNGPNTFDFEVK